MNENDLNPVIAAARATALERLATMGGTALLIGVEDYADFPGQALFAGRNDVLAYWKICRRLGYRAEHIRVRTSPVLTRDEILQAEIELSLGRKIHRGKPRAEVVGLVEKELADVPWDEVLGPATRAGIVDGVTWLAKQLVFTFRAAWEGQEVRQEMAALPGFFAYSGHGAQLPGDLALCPSDVKRGDGGIDNALSFADLRKLLNEGDDIPGQGPAPTDNLTVVLDCCFAAAGADDDAMLASSLTPAGTPSTPPATEIGSRVFCASARDEQAYQAMLGGRWHGAFTWAFTRTLEQWKTAPSGQFKRSTISHAELLFRARMLLEAMSFPQHPVLVDRISNTPVFWHRSDVLGKKDTKSDPDAERRGVQLDPSLRNYAVYLWYGIDRTGAQVLLAKVVATNTAVEAAGMAARQEYWQVVNLGFNTDDYTDLTVQKSDWYVSDGLPPFSVRAASFTCPVDLGGWTSATGGTCQTILGEDRTPTAGGFNVRVAFDTASAAWTANMAWYRAQGSGSLLFDRGGASTQKLAFDDVRSYRTVNAVTTLGGPLLSGSTYEVCSAGTCYLTKESSSGGYYYAYWSSDESKAVTHRITKIGGAAGDLIHPGDTVYLATTQSGLGAYVNLSYSRVSGYENIWYVDSQGSDEAWIVARADGSTDTSAIRTGEQLTLKNASGTKILTAETNNYLCLRAPGDTGYRGNTWALL